MSLPFIRSGSGFRETSFAPDYCRPPRVGLGGNSPLGVLGGGALVAPGAWVDGGGGARGVLGLVVLRGSGVVVRSARRVSMAGSVPVGTRGSAVCSARLVADGGAMVRDGSAVRVAAISVPRPGRVSVASGNRVAAGSRVPSGGRRSGVLVCAAHQRRESPRSRRRGRVWRRRGRGGGSGRHGRRCQVSAGLVQGP